jgi:hypothetical protein
LLLDSSSVGGDASAVDRAVVVHVVVPVDHHAWHTKIAQPVEGGVYQAVVDPLIVEQIARHQHRVDLVLGCRRFERVERAQAVVAVATIGWGREAAAEVDIGGVEQP